MSKTEQGRTETFPEPENSLETVRSGFTPSLNYEGDGNGYVRFETVNEASDLFSGYEKTFDYLDNLTDENLVVDPDTSAEVLEHYFGQYSHNSELREHLEYIDESVLDEGEMENLDSSIVLRLDITDYDGQQHIYFHEGEVSEETVEFLSEESSWSRYIHFLEDEDMLFIRSP